MKTPRKLSLVKFDYSGYDEQTVKEYKKMFGDDVCIFLGEIPNMKGHCVVISKHTGQVYSGLHSENFVEISPED